MYERLKFGAQITLCVFHKNTECVLLKALEMR
jgi:hypothetical protein